MRRARCITRRASGPAREAGEPGKRSTWPCKGKCRTRWPGERAAHFGDNRHNALAGSYDFSRATTIVDVGGGNGEMLRRILARYPDARGIVLDREDVVAAITDETVWMAGIC